MIKQLLIPIAILIFLVLGTTAVVLYGKGYRINTNPEQPTILETGLLVTTSQPDGAQVFINGHLTTATNNTINLSPRTYQIKIVKEGYFPWEKTIKMQKGLVSVTGALLFAKAPKLESLTEIGVSNPVLDPSKTKIAFQVASESARRNGTYVLDMHSRPIITLRSAATQIVDDTLDNFSAAKLAWSPDGQEILATIASNQNPDFATTYLLKASAFNENAQNVTATLDTLMETWENEILVTEQAQIESLTPKLKNLIKKNFEIIEWSQDKTKILYSASQSAELQLMISPPLIGTDSTSQERSIQKGSIYVYDIKEDKNFKIDIGNWQLSSEAESGSAGEIVRQLADQGSLALSWFPDSKHLVFVEDKKIGIMEHDGTNKTTIYAGPFTDNYVFPWPDGSKLVVLTNLGNPDITPNLYTVGLK